MPAVLIFFPHGDIDNRVRYARGVLANLNIPQAQIGGTTIHKYSRKFWVKKTQRQYHCPDEEFHNCRDIITKLIKAANPRVVIINDIVVYNNLFDIYYKSKSLETVRGSTFTHPEFPNITFTVHDDYAKCYRKAFNETDNPEISAFVSIQDFKKAVRIYNGNTRSQDNFESNYQLVDTIDKLHELEAHCSDAKLLSTDCETSLLNITCVGISILDANNQVYSYTVPILRGDTNKRNFWQSLDDELTVWRVLKRILELPNLPKAMQNGVYDLHYFFRYNIFPKNFILDTQLLMHSFSAEMKKSLAFISSLMCDNYYYWKDEISGTSADKDAPIKQRLPVSTAGTLQYYMYCGKDCYFTLYSAIYFLPMLKETPWIRDNYVRTLKLQHGPCLEMSLRGFRTNAKRLQRITRRLALRASMAKQKLSIAVDDPSFNPNSPKQATHLFFDLLKTPMIRKKRSVNEKYLRRLTIRDPIAYAMFRMFRDFKEPSKLATDLKSLKLYKGRMMYAINAAGTWTGRAASKSHHWWVGKNIQNFNKNIRKFCIADEGYFILSIDYSQSDGYFVAYESQDLNYITVMSKNMNEGYDTHAYHVQLLLKTPYDEVIEGKKNKVPKIVHPIKGQRNIIKRVVHGCNYVMGPDTMLTTVGNESIVAAAVSVGYKKAHAWTDEELKYFVKQIQGGYFSHYKGVVQWQKNEAKATVERGNVIQAYGGRTHMVFGNPTKDKSGRLVRKIAAFKGQGGTAGNINRSLLKIFYNTDLRPQGVQLLNQIHDEINFQIPYSKLHLVNNILSIMEERVTINGREFFVPCEAELGLTWQIYCDFDRNITDQNHYFDMLNKKERKYNEELFGKTKTETKLKGRKNSISAMLLDQLYNGQ